MARKRIRATMTGTVAEDNVAYQEVVFQINDEVVDTKTVGPEGGEATSAGFDFDEAKDNTVKVLVTPVDTGNNRAMVPAIAAEVFKGVDVIPPATPEAPTFVLEDDAAVTV